MQYIYTDYFRKYGRKRPKLTHKFFSWRVEPQIKHFILIRKWKKSRNKLYKAFIKIRLKSLKKVSLIDIPPQTKLGDGLYMYHTGRVIINSHVKIGKNVTLSPGITIGKTINKTTEKDESPTIGNRVWIGSNAVIVGDVTDGDNVLIAANSFITKDVPSNSVVFGNPAIIKEDRLDATKGYIKNPV